MTRLKKHPWWTVGIVFCLSISLVLAMLAGTLGVVSADAVEITIDEVIASGFTHPVQVTHAGDDRLFVVEQPGRIKIIEDGSVLGTPFLDITALTNDVGEQGLLGLAFHPDYPDVPYFYIDYTRADNGNTVIARYAVSGDDPNRADPNSATTILTVEQPYGNHNGGQVMFNPVEAAQGKNYLYIGMGDGGSGGDPLEAGQDPTTLLGALLRINVDGGAPYGIPPDNPYDGTTGREEIWAIGLRNPWRFSFDRATGDLYIGDVGQNEWEEISFQDAATPGGVNFGWDCYEGPQPYEWAAGCDDADLTMPIAEYGHDVGRSVTGGFVYRGSLYPALQGRYFYADYVSGRIWSLAKTDSGFTAPELELETALNISAFGEDSAGEIYVVGRGGSVRRLADANGADPAPNLSDSHKQASTMSADSGERVRYKILLVNSGGAVEDTVALTDTVPNGLQYVAGSLSATSGTVDDTQAPTLTWQGSVGAETTVTVSYEVDVTGAVTGSLVNYATARGPSVGVDLATALFVPRTVLTSTMTDFFLPGTQPGTLAAGIPDSVDCDICHNEPIYDRWRGTMMSQSGRDPLVWAALATANADVPGAGDYCLRCHAPRGWLEGRSHPADGSVLTAQDTSNGVACAVCHRMVDPLPTESEIAAIDASVRNALTATIPSDYVGSATLIVDPNVNEGQFDNRRGPFSFAQDLPHGAYQTAFLGQDSEAVTRSRLCGTCHDLDNPLLQWDAGRGQYWPNEMDLATANADLDDLFPIERTYSEWLNSDYATGGVYAPEFAGSKPDGVVEACQDCHLQRVTGVAADEQFNPVTRDCGTRGCLPEHMMVGGNAWIPQLLQDPDWRLSAENDAEHLDVTLREAEAMLRKAARLTVTLAPSGTQKIATVRVINESGHKLPTGYPEGRLMWLNLRAYNAADTLVYQSGAYDPATGQLNRDGDIKIYEIKQGITPQLADVLGLPAGESFHFVLNNTVVKDNRIPPRGYTQAAFDEDGLRPVGATYADGQHWDETTYVLPGETERVFVRLYYQTASKEYVDFLRANGGVDGEALGALWEKSKSPPVLMEMTFNPVATIYLPVIFKDG
jgi:uncharacterized repeat protein (TIGR01451 family)